MNRLPSHAAFAVGLLAIAWTGAGYVPGSPLAAALVLCIGAFYLLGALELRRFTQATDSLAALLASTTTPPAEIDPWLARLHPSLRNAVRLRVEGERVGLPGPALTPYLSGLLVLLGMLGTFLGMVVTLKGTGLALENASDVDAIRASLAAPVKGLGLAFGTSVAGVAASAMLGLMSALARRERQRCAQRLDACSATTLRVLSRSHQRDLQRDTALRLLQQQADAVPTLVAQLHSLATQMERQGQAQHEQLQASQQRLQASTEQAYAGLAASVGASLQASLGDSARVAAAALQPAVQATLQGLAHEAAAVQAALQQHAQQAVAATVAGVERQAAHLLHGVAQAHTAMAERSAAQENERQQRSSQALEALGARLVEQAEAQARATLAELAGLAQAAAEAPRVAADVITQMRAALSDSLLRDTTLLEDRQRQAAQLDAALAALDAAATRFGSMVEAQSHSLQAVAAQVHASAAEVASLGEGFGAAVQLFSRASEQTTAQLQRIEAALGQAMSRSDEQLAYYVAQAREIVDLTLGSQKQLMDDLQRLAPKPPAANAANAA